ncbi:winged helix-turn-helix transcriptional regulator (plasmid) [Cupriavidus sp. KK10]|jgi:DNA-binding MarR family transcriptional regulator|uniref:MarR family winged helix-turn-helix transcriptional regulator n=1 Tax=Cupriavidus sp. KK10 TaxID=1478019 RepID=UPI001BA6C775|nr:MarR family winged helix-turn-helix transcriptional regulator [Cupriavidus sp. KK10]QUN32548.1 winged helix-turn-helix transcriptional regulator [Cupriavidus sp. KK10]
MTVSSKAMDEFDGRCNCLAARQAARYLTAVYDKALQPVNLRATQFSILHKLANHGPLTIGELAGEMAMDRTTLATNLKPLERDGLVNMAAGVDRRVKNASVTKAGMIRYRKAFPLWLEVQTEFEAAYGGERKAANLREAMRAVLTTGFEPWAEAGVA